MEQELAAIFLDRIAKRFGAVVALDEASLFVRPRSVHALLGENGAGKTTLMRIAFGLLRPDAGEIRLHGRPVSWSAPADAIRAGVGMVHQHFTLVPAMTVAENIELGAGGVDARGGRRWRFDRRSAEQRVRELGRSSGLEVEPDALVGGLPIAMQQRVEILKALSRAATVLILDEPTAVLAPAESRDLLGWLRAYADAGGAAILITHKLREALAVADDITVLRRGRTVLTASRTEAREDVLTVAMIGDEVAATSEPITGAGSLTRPVAILEDVVATDPEHGERIRATLSVYAGEILGVAGIEGAGQHTLLRVLAGRIRPEAGRLTRPAEVGFIPEDRHQDGLVLDFSLTQNVALRDAGVRRGRMHWADLERRTGELIRDLDIRAPSPAARARGLSGGNQQRLVLGRELAGRPTAARPTMVVAENPTRGLDVRATADVHGRLRAAAQEGTAVVLYSSDLDEVLALSTRIVVVHGGAVREVPADRDLVGRAILGLP